MKVENHFENIRILVSNNELIEAINLLKKTSNYDVRDQAIILESQINDLNKKERLDMLSQEEKSKIERIKYSILKINSLAELDSSSRITKKYLENQIETESILIQVHKKLENIHRKQEDDEIYHYLLDNYPKEACIIFYSSIRIFECLKTENDYKSKNLIGKYNNMIKDQFTLIKKNHNSEYLNKIISFERKIIQSPGLIARYEICRLNNSSLRDTLEYYSIYFKKKHTLARKYKKFGFIGILTSIFVFQIRQNSKINNLKTIIEKNGYHNNGMNKDGIDENGVDKNKIDIFGYDNNGNKKRSINNEIKYPINILSLVEISNSVDEGFEYQESIDQDILNNE